MTDAGLLAEQLEWAATTPAAQNEDYNVVNGDVFRWKWMWQQIADYFGIEAAPFPGEMQPLEGRMLAAEDDWRQIAQNISCASRTLPVWPRWHTDADLGRPMEVFTDISKAATPASPATARRAKPSSPCLIS